MIIKITLDDNSFKSDSVLNFFFAQNSNELYSPLAKTTASSFDKEFSKESSFLFTGILPPAVRYLSTDRKFFIWERPPDYVTVSYGKHYQTAVNADDHSHKNSWRIPLPWQRYLVCLDSTGYISAMYLSLHSSQMTNFKDIINLPPLPNFYGDGHLCLALYNHSPEGDRTVEKGISLAYNMVWGSGFNKDLFDSYNALQSITKNPLHSKTGNVSTFFSTWSTYSIEDVLTWPWYKTGVTFHQFISSKAYLSSLGGSTNEHSSTLTSIFFSAQEASI